MSRLRVIVIVVVMTFGIGTVGYSQCATQYQEIAYDGAGHAHAWVVITDNYTNYHAPCVPAAWKTNGFSHSYGETVTITSPSGRKTTVTGSGGQQGNTATGSLRTDASLAVNGEQGTFTETGDGDIICTVAGEFFNDNFTEPFLPPPPAINGVEDNSTSSNTIYINTSGYLAIYGTGLTAWGETPIPTINGDSDVTLTYSYADDNQVNVSYTVKPNAAIGTHSLTITTEGGTSNAGSYTVEPPLSSCPAN